MRIVNAAKSGYFQLYLDGESVTQIGGDGGLQEFPVEVRDLVLAPGERADVIVVPKTSPGKELVVRWVPFNRGYGSVELRTDEDLMVIAMADLPPHVAAPLPDIGRAIEPTSAVGATPVDLRLTIIQLLDKSFEYGINGVPFWKAKSLLAKPRETQIWTLTNTTPWSHPFHLHGFFFQVLDKDGAPMRPMAWKDTVNVPFEQAVKVIVRFDDREGTWMFHCHVLDHADGGLMGTVQVGAASGTNHHHYK